MPRMTRGKTSRRIVQEAREQRRHATPAEEKLWGELRNRRLGGLKFRCQHPFNRYILDFFCVSQLLVVELDGGVHDEEEQREHDLERTAYLEEQGLTVLRFKNTEVEDDIGAALDTILQHTSPSSKLSSLSPPPSPDCTSSGEGGGLGGG